MLLAIYKILQSQPFLVFNSSIEFKRCIFPEYVLFYISFKIVRIKKSWTSLTTSLATLLAIGLAMILIVNQCYKSYAVEHRICCHFKNNIALVL